MLRKKQIMGWCLFDFANSSYSAIIAAVVFPVYYTSRIASGSAGAGDLWWGRAVSVSMAIVALTSPFLGGLADFGGARKKLLFLYTATAVLSVSMFSFLREGMAFEGLVLFALANIGMEGGLVFYNSYLTDIAEKEYQGRVSSWGYAVGYAGSILSLLVALPLVKAGLFNWTWLMVAAMFMLFSLPAFAYLPQDAKKEKPLRAAAMGMGSTLKTLRDIWRGRESRKFLLAYLVYEDGVNTVIVFSSVFAAATLGFRPPELIALYIVVQLTALAGAFLMARPVDYWGPKKVVILSLALWCAVTILAYTASSKGQFWVVAVVAGLGLGTVQAATRAFFAQFVPRGHEAEYFGVYALAGKSSAIIGPYLFGSVSEAFQSQRPAILLIAVFFVVGLLMVGSVRGGGPNAGLDREI